MTYYKKLKTATFFFYAVVENSFVVSVYQNLSSIKKKKTFLPILQPSNILDLQNSSNNFKFRKKKRKQPHHL